MFLAKALFDNVAETPDELAFRRGDVITVMPQDTVGGGLGGWWLCSFRGRQGIAPANRLKILSGVMEDTAVTKDQYSAGPHDYDVPPSRHYPPSTGPSSGSSLYDAPTNMPTSPNGPPFNMLTSRSSHPGNTPSFYDTPPASNRASTERSPSSRNQHASMDNLCSASSQSLSSTSNTSNAITRSPVPANTMNSFYEIHPSWKQASGKKNPPPGSQRASMDNALSVSFQALSIARDQHQQQPEYQRPTSSKQGSYGRGGLRLSESGSVKLYRWDNGDSNFPSSKSFCQSHSGSKRFSVEVMLSDDHTTYGLSSSGHLTEMVGGSTYDIPNPRSRRQSRDYICAGSGSRDSVLSTASSESCIIGSSAHQVHNRHSSAASLSESTLSCLDDSLEETSKFTSSDSRASKQLSLDSGFEGLYDIPASVCQKSTCPPPVPDRSTSLSLIIKDHSHVDIQRCHSLDDTADSCYDFPYNSVFEVGMNSAQSGAGSVCNTPSPVYDIPHQMIRQPIKSAGSNSSYDSFRLSSCSMDSCSSGVGIYCLAEGMYEEIQLGMDSAIDLLTKHQKNITQSASRVLMFVSSTWRTKEYLQANVCDIKTACTELKDAMTKFMEFAQGILVNSAHLSDRKLVSQFMKQVAHLQQHLRTMSEALDCLEDMKWQVDFLAEPLKPDQKDHLDSVICLAKDLTPDVKKLVSLIHGNSSLLFKRFSDTAAPSQDSEPVDAMSTQSVIPRRDIPEAGAGKGRSEAAMIRSRSVQQRPLPPLPVSTSGAQLCLPPVTRSRAMLNDKVSRSEGVQCCTTDDDDDGDKDYSDLLEDYDYVHLKPRDVLAQHRSKKQQQDPSQYKQCLKDIDEEGELPDIPASDNRQSTGKSPGQDTCSEIIQKPVHHTEKVFADLGEKQLDTDKALTFKNITQTVSGHEDIPNGLLSGKPDSQEPLKIPAYNMNESKNPILCSPSNTFAVTAPALESSDKHVLCYYSEQLDTHSTLLTNAIDAFITSIHKNDPPNVFISHVKFVIVTAFKLIYISDTLQQSLVSGELGHKVMCCSSHLCECVRVTVQATKTAALQFPSACAVQAMVDRVVDVSLAAHELRLVVTQASVL